MKTFIVFFATIVLAVSTAFAKGSNAEVAVTPAITPVAENHVVTKKAVVTEKKANKLTFAQKTALKLMAKPMKKAIEKGGLDPQLKTPIILIGIGLILMIIGALLPLIGLLFWVIGAILLVIGLILLLLALVG
ncbi:MAG: hypothetical protein MUF42_04280 [Cytophagaceae bacterium]|jgi:hypothetical protein|nr:hypothetical protein [Cytophagaceae bacterium]